MRRYQVYIVGMVVEVLSWLDRDEMVELVDGVML